MKVHIGKYPSTRAKNQTRKISVKIDKWDSWNADQTIAIIAYPLLLQLQETKQGAPYVDNEDVPENIRSTNAKPFDADNGDIDEFHFQRWNYVIDEMIWVMKEISENKPTEDTFFDHSACDDNSSVMEQIKAIKVDTDGLEEYNIRMKKACLLFGKYFLSLWD
jgi:hypothetical protein